MADRSDHNFLYFTKICFMFNNLMWFLIDSGLSVWIVIRDQYLYYLAFDSVEWNEFGFWCVTEFY